MRIIITGATGSLGAYLTRWFAAKGHHVYAVGRTANPPAQLLECSTYIKADITQSLSFPDADVCIHCAGLADDKATPSALFAANVLGTQNVIQASRHCYTGIYVSSSSVYAHTEQPITEEMMTDRAVLSHYGLSKLLAERCVVKHARHASSFILRPRAIYGAGDKVLLPRLLKLIRGGTVVSVGDMKVKLSLTHFSNFAMAVEACINSHLTGMHTYNVADDSVYVLRDVVTKLARTLCGDRLREQKLPLWIFALLSAFEVGEYTPLFINTVSKNLVLDTSRIKKELNFFPSMNLDASLDEIDRWVSSIGGVNVLKKADPVLAWM